MSPQGIVEDALFVYNVTMPMPEMCNNITITLFTAAAVGSMRNISVIGKINITNTNSKTQVKFAMTYDSRFDSTDENPIISHNLTVYITGGKANVTTIIRYGSNVT